jgi:hypothetical protein
MPWFKAQNQRITEAMLPLKSLQLGYLKSIAFDNAAFHKRLSVKKEKTLCVVCLR